MVQKQLASAEINAELTAKSASIQRSMKVPSCRKCTTATANGRFRGNVADFRRNAWRRKLLLYPPVLSFHAGSTQKGSPLTSPPRALAATLVAVVTILLTTPSKTAEPAALKTIVVLPFEIEDTSGEVGPADRHDAMLGRLTAFVRNEIASAQFYRVEPENLTDEAVKAVNAGTFLRGCHGCEIDIAKRLGASHVLVGWIYKVSTLILAL